MYALQLRPDVRVAEPDERMSTCRRCGVRLVVLPEDRRYGFCFDCYDPSDVHATAF